MESVNATVGELPARRSRIALAGQRRELLSEKRTAVTSATVASPAARATGIAAKMRR